MEKIEFLTPEEIAEQMKITPKTVREWLKSGELKGRKYGRQWRIRKEDYQAFLEADPKATTLNVSKTKGASTNGKNGRGKTK